MAPCLSKCLCCHGTCHYSPLPHPSCNITVAIHHPRPDLGPIPILDLILVILHLSVRASRTYLLGLLVLGLVAEVVKGRVLQVPLTVPVTPWDQTTVNHQAHLRTLIGSIVHHASSACLFLILNQAFGTFQDRPYNRKTIVVVHHMKRRASQSPASLRLSRDQTLLQPLNSSARSNKHLASFCTRTLQVYIHIIDCIAHFTRILFSYSIYSIIYDRT